MALNTVAGANNAWQERKAESFSVTPLHSGNEWVKYWPTGNYGSYKNGLSLGTAIAISGAAASPNMGYHSSPLVGLVMTLFNVRLGWWLGNPSQPRTAPQESPPFGMVQFLSELFGLTNDRSRYVYLSDGGHFENLGLYELVRRKMDLIVVSDGGQDGDFTFADLGNAIERVRVDFGVSIHFDDPNFTLEGVLPQPRQADSATWKDKFGLAKRGFALASIVYPDRESNGVLIYVKATMIDGLPSDLYAYKAQNPEFPDQTTLDQFFDEDQFEAYRELGYRLMKRMLQELNRARQGASPASLPSTALEFMAPGEIPS
jgi:hypothetical protein